MMLSDSVKNTLDNFEVSAKKIPDDILKNMYANLVAMNPECFEPYTNDGSKPVLKTNKYKSAKKLFETLATSKYLKNFASIYEAYLFYSKYDHFGRMFYGLSRQSPLDKLAFLDKAIRAFPRVLLFTLVILESMSPGNQFLIDTRKRAEVFIDTIENIQ